MKLRVGTRGSLLATTQTAQSVAALQGAHPDLEVETVLIRTTGDARQDVPLSSLGGDGLFVKELERALLEERIDNPPENELRIAAGEQAKISKLRLAKLLDELANEP